MMIQKSRPSKSTFLYLRTYELTKLQSYKVTKLPRFSQNNSPYLYATFKQPSPKETAIFTPLICNTHKVITPNIKYIKSQIKQL
jgi:hypothetical protein